MLSLRVVVFFSDSSSSSAGKETLQCCSVQRQEVRRDRYIKHIARPASVIHNGLCVAFGQYPSCPAMVCDPTAITGMGGGGGHDLLVDTKVCFTPR